MVTHNASSEYIGWRLEVFVGVFTPLQVVFVALRFYARSLASSPWAWDDVLILVSLLGQLVASGIAIGSVEQSAVGYHVEYLEQTNPAAVVLFLKYLVAISAWYFATIWISKVAICLFFRRLFPQRPVQIITMVLAIVLVCTSIVCVIVDLIACKPFSANWAPPPEQAIFCLDKEAFFVWSTLPNIVTDVVMLVLPLPIIWRLHTSTQMKGALTVTFLIGSIGLVASILRFWAFSNTNSFTDATYNAVELIIWTVVEPGIYLIGACMLVFRPLLDKVSRGSFRIGSKAKSRGYSQHMAKGNDHSGRGTSQEADIVLRSNTNGGFERLTDEYPHELRAYATSRQPEPGQDPKNIRITTDIEQSWN